MRSIATTTTGGRSRKVLSGAVAAVILLAAAGCSSDSGSSDKSSAPPSDDLSYAVPKVDPKLRALLPDSFANVTTLVGGSSLATPPFNFTDPTTGEPTGYFVDIATAAGAKLGLEVSWEKQPYPGLITALQTKKIQFFSPGSPSADALKVINVVAVTQRSASLLVPKGNPKKIEEITDACGLKLALVAGSILDEQAANSITKACADSGEAAPGIETYPSAADAQTGVRSGRADGLVQPDVVSIYQSDATGFYDAVLLGKFPAANQGLGFLKADGTELPEAFVAAVKALQKEGIYQKILKKYGVEKVAAIDGEPELITGE